MITRATADHEWSAEEIRHQIAYFARKVSEERLAQEDRWGKQNVPDLQEGTNGVHIVGRPYRSMAQIMKYQCRKAHDEGHDSMDLILLEEVFEALEKAVEAADAPEGAIRDTVREELITELVQVAAVAVKWAAMVERDEPR